jgi:hypothetical protein
VNDSNLVAVQETLAKANEQLGEAGRALLPVFTAAFTNFVAALRPVALGLAQAAAATDAYRSSLRSKKGNRLAR